MSLWTRLRRLQDRGGRRWRLARPRTGDSCGITFELEAEEAGAERERRAFGQRDARERGHSAAFELVARLSSSPATCAAACVRSAQIRRFGHRHRRSPLALASRTCTAMFSAVDAVLIRPLPCADANRLMAIRTR